MHSDVCRIPLGTRGLYDAIVDADDYAALTQWRWNFKRSRGGGIYARRGGGRVGRRRTPPDNPHARFHFGDAQGRAAPVAGAYAGPYQPEQLDNRRGQSPMGDAERASTEHAARTQERAHAEKRREILRELAAAARAA
jgi:hypothetical protein